METREEVSDDTRRAVPTGTASALSARGIHQETCEKWGYVVGTFDGKPCQIAVYRDDDTGAPVAAKVRFADKTFTFAGAPKRAHLYGKWLWSGGGKMLTITEGEIDALSVSQSFGNKFPVVSIPNGAQAALKAIEKDYEWVCSFERVNIWFDNDEPGRKAAREVAEALPPGKAHIVKAELKDANEYLKLGRVAEISNLVWRAEAFRPDGIVSGSALWEQVRKEDASYTTPYPYDGLNHILRGLRECELVTVTAGTGVGKSAFVREIMYSLIQRGEKVGGIFLEESVKRSAMGLMGLHVNKPIHIDREGVTEEELRKAFEATVGKEGVYFYDHFGSVEVDNILSRIRYLARGCGCKWIVLDHLSILMSGLELDNEREALDRAMTMLRTLVQELNIGMILVCHLRRPMNDRGHERGAEVSLNQLRGSHSIGQLSDAVIGLERDQQSEDESMITTVRVLKNRFTGETGIACQLRYDRETGRLIEQPNLGEPVGAEEPAF